MPSKKDKLNFNDDDVFRMNTMDTLMQKMTRMTKRATTMVHMMGVCNCLENCSHIT